MTIPICPFCLTHHDFGAPPRCEQTHQIIPQQYIDNYDREPPIWLMTAGFQGHGKTYFLGSLAMHIQNMSYLWPNATYGVTDEHTQEFIDRVIEYMIAQDGVGMPPTERTIPTPLIIQTNNIPEFDSHWLVMYDVAGQYFSSLRIESDMENLQSLNAAKNIWFFIDLQKIFDSDREKNINDLLNVYLKAMSSLGWSLSGRNIIVVYTKADLLIEYEPEKDQDESPYLTKQICNYYLNDPYVKLIQCTTNRNTRKEFAQIREQFAMPKYLEGMSIQSNALREYTLNEVPGGKNFIQKTEDSQMGLEFCLVSSTGTEFIQDHPQAEILPHRVLDPLLWTLKLNLNLQVKKIKIVLDSKISTESFIALNLNRIYKTLQRVDTEIYIYYLGCATPSLIASQEPPKKLPMKEYGPRYIGPILDDGNINSITILLTSNPVDDLEDFMQDEWMNRLFYVSIAEDHLQNWSGAKLLFQNTSDLQLLISEIKKLL